MTKNFSILFVVVLCGCLITAACQNSSPSANNNQTADNQTVKNNNQAVKTEPKATPVASATPDAAKATDNPDDPYTALKAGMTYEEVIKILGSEGKLLNENEIGATKTATYQWKAEGSSGSNVQVIFSNGKMFQKFKYGEK